MDTKDIITLAEFLSEHLGVVFVVLIIAVLSVFEFSKIKLNPWSAVGRWLGRIINGELMEKLNMVDAKVDKLEAAMDERAAKDARIRILRFGDEVLHGVEHSKEHFDQILQDIAEYDQYCKDHPKFINNMTHLTSKEIMKTYSATWEKKDFR